MRVEEQEEEKQEGCKLWLNTWRALFTWPRLIRRRVARVERQHDVHIWS